MEKLSEFVYAEAERYAKIGIVDLAQISWIDVHKEKSGNRVSRSNNLALVCSTSNEDFCAKDQFSFLNEVNISKCVRCNKDAHMIFDCDEFAQDSSEARWMVASKSRLCFTCLRAGHMRNQCKEKSCTQFTMHF